MDLGFAGATAVVTGGSKGMGRAVAEILATDGARVAVMARGRGALDETVEALHRAGSPDAVGIGVDMTDRSSIDCGVLGGAATAGAPSTSWFTRSGRPPDASSNSTTPVGTTAFTLGTMSGVRSVRSAPPAPASRRMGEDRDVLGALDPAPEPDPRRLHGVEGRGDQRGQEPGQVARARGDPGERGGCPGSIVTASFTENLREMFAAEGLDPSDPHDVMTWIDRTFHQPADLGRAGLPDEVASLMAYLVSRRNGYVTGACVNADGGSDFV